MSNTATNHPAAGPPSRPLSRPLADAQAGWWPADAALAFDFMNRRYMAGGQSFGTFSSVPGVSVSRASRAWAVDPDNIPVMAGIDEPLIVSGRGLICEPAATRLNNIDLLNAAATGASTTVEAVNTVLPDGTTGTAYRVYMPATGGTFINVTGVLPEAAHTIQVWAKDNAASMPNFALSAGAGAVQTESKPQWQRFSLTQTADGILAATINNRFDTFATDVLFVWPDVQAGTLASPILEPGATATRAAATIEVTGLTAFPGIAADHAFTATFEDATTTTLTASGGTLAIPAGARAYSLITG